MLLTDPSNPLQPYAEALASLFPEEYHKLNAEEAEILAADCRDADVEDARSPVEYRNAIGRGNLLAYVDCLIAGIDRKGIF